MAATGCIESPRWHFTSFPKAPSLAPGNEAGDLGKSQLPQSTIDLEIR